MADDLLQHVLLGLQSVAGLAPSEVLRRRLLRATALLTPLAGCPANIDDPDWAALIDAVTVQETRLFRHAVVFEVLETEVMPTLHRDAGAAARPLRILSAGCATGEEAYSLAVVALGQAQPLNAQKVEVIGLDLSRPAIAAARNGVYRAGPPDAMREVPAHYRTRFEPCEPQSVRAVEPVRAVTRFRRANLLQLPELFTGTADLVVCRHVLMYFSLAARAEAFAGLTRLLRPGGALLLGATDAPPAGLPLEPWSSGTSALWRRKHGAL